MLRRKNKQKKRQPSIEEFLQYRPKRRDIEWSKNTEGLVELKVPKFKSNFGKSFCKVTRKDDTFAAKMDKIGSLVWRNSDGNRNVSEILEILKTEFPDEKNIDQRLILFIQQMKALNYLAY